MLWGYTEREKEKDLHTRGLGRRMVGLLLKPVVLLGGVIVFVS